MISLDAFQKRLSKVSSSIRPNVVDVLNNYGKLLLVDFRERSAEDTGRFKQSWRLMKAKPSGSRFSITLKNATQYSNILVEGADLNSAPWNFPGTKSKEEVSSPSGKLMVGHPRGAFGWFISGSRTAVWAGGLKPGKSKALGGVKAGLLSDPTFQKEFIADLKKAMIIGL